MVMDNSFGYNCENESSNFSDFNKWRNYVLIGEVNDGNTFYANGGVAGHAGLFSTTGDLAVLGQTMLNGGGYGDIRIYDKAIISDFHLRKDSVRAIDSKLINHGIWVQNVRKKLSVIQDLQILR